MSRHLHAMSPGDPIRLNCVPEEWTFDGHKWERVLMLAGGTGITPMVQIIQFLFGITYRPDGFQCRLLFANRTRDEVILESELEEFVQKSDGWMSVRHLISQDQKTPERIDESVISESLNELQKNLDDPTNFGSTLVLIC
eukprot:139055_1